MCRSRSTHRQIHLDYSAKLLSRSAYLPGIKLHRRSRALTRVERALLGRFTGLLSSHPILITYSVRALFMQRGALLHGRLRKSCPALISVLHLRRILSQLFPVAALSLAGLPPPPPTIPTPNIPEPCFIWLTALPRISIPPFRLFPSFSRQSA